MQTFPFSSATHSYVFHIKVSTCKASHYSTPPRHARSHLKGLQLSDAGVCPCQGCPPLCTCCAQRKRLTACNNVQVTPSTDPLLPACPSPAATVTATATATATASGTTTATSTGRGNSLTLHLDAI